MRTKGRQPGGYKKLKIFESKRLKMDMYLLYFPCGSEVSPHKDPATEGYIHKRTNITLKKPKEGGLVFVEGPVLNIGRFSHFMPSEWRHLMTKITKGSCLMLSIGWLTPR